MRNRVLACAGVVWLWFGGWACQRRAKPVEDLRSRENVSEYTFTQMRGRRDGDVLRAQAGFSDGKRAFILDLVFHIETSASLQAGRWEWVGDGQRLDGGTVEAKSVMFLGGQNGPPSIGGTYDLLDEKGAAAFRVRIPASELEDRTPKVR